MKVVMGELLLNSSDSNRRYCGFVGYLLYLLSGSSHEPLLFYGAVAHLGERFNGIEEVASSILASSTTILPVEADFQRQLLVS